MPYHTTDRDGITDLNPSKDRLREILESLNDDDPKDPEVWLTHDSGWTLNVYPTGLLILEKEGEPNRTLATQSINEAFSLWLQLAEGDITALLKYNWKEDSE